MLDATTMERIYTLSLAMVLVGGCNPEGLIGSIETEGAGGSDSMAGPGDDSASSTTQGVMTASGSSSSASASTTSGGSTSSTGGSPTAGGPSSTSGGSPSSTSGSTSSSSTSGTSTTDGSGTGEPPECTASCEVDCVAEQCGPLSPFDETGCLRTACSDDEQCAGDERCYIAAEFGGCVSSGISCSEGNGTCSCISTDDCGGGYCVDEADYPGGGSGSGGGDEQALCESTNGIWDTTTCDHYTCGLPNGCLAIIPGCDCGPGRNFEDGLGCVDDSACVFSCGQTDCQVGLEYCSEFLPGVPDTPPSYSCVTMPETCNDLPTCNCLAEAGVSGTCSVDRLGELTVTLAAP